MLAHPFNIDVLSTCPQHDRATKSWYEVTSNTTTITGTTTDSTTHTTACPEIL
jgi:hypothetical protein